MEETVIDDIISLESSLNDEFLTMVDAGLQLTNTVKQTGNVGKYMGNAWEHKGN